MGSEGSKEELFPDLTTHAAWGSNACAAGIIEKRLS
jgi:hypothetical protein